MNSPILQLRDVTKRIGSKTIIDGLSLEVPKGEVFGFLGPNGAGKTTTIRRVVGFDSILERQSCNQRYDAAVLHCRANLLFSHF